jgi:hypothetical protein
LLAGIFLPCGTPRCLCKLPCLDFLIFILLIICKNFYIQHLSFL